MSRSSFIHRRGGLRYPAEVMADGPILYWRFDEPSGTSATDYTGNGHTGTIHPGTGTISLGQPSPINSDGASTSYTFAEAGFNDTYVIAAASTAWDTTSVTIEAWVHPTSGQVVKHGVAAVDDTSDTPRWYVRIQPSTGNVELFLGGSALTTSANVSFDVWTYLVVTSDVADGLWKVYVNGVLASTGGPFSLGTLTNVNFTAARNHANAAGGETLVGGMDEVALYGTALSADRIAVHYNAAF